MASLMISLDSATLKSQNSNIRDNNDLLINNYYPRINELLDSISRNVQSAEINNEIVLCKNIVEDTSLTLGKNINSLIEFAEQQANTYDRLVSEAEAMIENSVNSMYALASESASVK